MRVRLPLPLRHDLVLVARMTHAIVLLLLASSIAGLLYGRRGWWYDSDPATLPAFLGQDVLSLVLVVPLLLALSILARRGSLRALVCWMGALFYVAYSYYFYVIGGRFNTYFPLYIAVVSMAAYGALAVLFSLDLGRLPSYFDRPPIRAISGFLIATALFFAGLWLTILARHFTTGGTLDAVTRTVIAVDGVVLLPLLFYGGLTLARREPLGYTLAGLLLVKSAATFLTLLVNTSLAAWWGWRVSGIETIAYAAGLVIATSLLARYLRSITAVAPA